MGYDLTDEYLAEARQRAYRYQGQWTGTAGALAADVARLLIERKRMESTINHLKESNSQLRAADDAPQRWKVMAQASAAKHAERLTGDSLLDDQGDIRPGSREFLEVLDELRALHLRKTKDYGVDEDALSNIRNSADVVNMPAWAGCILRISDKMHRLKAFFRRGTCEFDGVPDTLQDIACYAAIALVLYREQQGE
jgi:hypothetical protein